MTSSPCLYTPSCSLQGQDISKYYNIEDILSLQFDKTTNHQVPKIVYQYPWLQFLHFLLNTQHSQYVYNQFKTAIMNRKPVFYSNKHERKNIVDLSPRFAVKKPQPLRQGGIIAQASAQMKRRKPDAKALRLESPIYSRPKAELKKINEQKQMLSEQQIRNSALYKMLQQEIKQLARRQQQQIQKLKKIKQQRSRQAETVKKQQFATKLQIWELKNQVFDIKQLIQEEKNQTERLLQQIRPLGSNRQVGAAIDSSSQDLQPQQDEPAQNQQQSYQTEEEP